MGTFKTAHHKNYLILYYLFGLILFFFFFFWLTNSNLCGLFPIGVMDWVSDFNAFGVPWLGLKLLVLLSIYNIIRVLLHCVCAPSGVMSWDSGRESHDLPCSLNREERETSMPQRPFPALSRPSSLANRQAQPPARAGRPGQGDKKKEKKSACWKRREERWGHFPPPSVEKRRRNTSQPYSFPSPITFNSSFSFSLHPKWHLASEMSEERKKEDVG